MKKIKVLKTILLISLLLSIIFITSCEKKEEASISNNSVYVSSPDNIYHKTYTNVVKIQGKFVNMNSVFSYGNREEGEYSEDYDIFEAIENHSLKRVMELIKEGEDIDQNNRDFTMYNEFMDSHYIIESATPLIFAIFYRDLGIDINSTDEDGDGVLDYAEKDEAIEKLKELGAK